MTLTFHFTSETIKYIEKCLFGSLFTVAFGLYGRRTRAQTPSLTMPTLPRQAIERSYGPLVLPQAPGQRQQGAATGTANFSVQPTEREPEELNAVYRSSE